MKLLIIWVIPVNVINHKIDSDRCKFFFSLVATTVEPRIRIVHMGERQS